MLKVPFDKLKTLQVRILFNIKDEGRVVPVTKSANAGRILRACSSATTQYSIPAKEMSTWQPPNFASTRFVEKLC
jgi:hypothetical protein